MTGTFDPTLFLDAQTTEALDTTIIPCPAGEFPAVAEKIEPVQWSNADGSKTGMKFVITWEIQDPNVVQITGRDPTRSRQDVMLDLTDTGQLDLGKGKNISLGRVREAVGLNTPGEAFSPSMIAGRPALVTVGHRPDKNDPSVLYDEVKKVAKL